MIFQKGETPHVPDSSRWFGREAFWWVIKYDTNPPKKTHKFYQGKSFQNDPTTLISISSLRDFPTDWTNSGTPHSHKLAIPFPYGPRSSRDSYGSRMGIGVPLMRSHLSLILGEIPRSVVCLLYMGQN